MYQGWRSMGDLGGYPQSWNVNTRGHILYTVGQLYGMGIRYGRG